MPADLCFSTLHFFAKEQTDQAVGTQRRLPQQQGKVPSASLFQKTAMNGRPGNQLFLEEVFLASSQDSGLCRKGREHPS